MWRLWLQGEDNAPDICKACLASLRRWYPEKEIITLNNDNISDYVTLPGCIQDKYERGIIDNTKYANLIRLQLLIEHGGTWVDSTVLFTGRQSEHLMHLPLFAFRLWQFTDVPSNWFIVSDAHNPLLMLIRDLHFEYWKRHDYFVHYFIFHMFFLMAIEKYPEEWRNVPFIYDNINHDMQRAMYEDYSEEKMKRLTEACDIHKLTYNLTKGVPSSSSIYQHIIDLY